MMGRIIGALLGWMALKGFWGLLLGFLAGWYFDKAITKTMQDNRVSANSRIQPLFMQLLFTTLGRLAKADGRVSEEEIQHAENIIRQLGLDNDGRKQAIQWFQEGVKGLTDFDALLNEFALVSRGRLQLRRALLEMLVQQAFVDGIIHANEEALLTKVAAALGVPAAAFKLLLQQLKAQQQFNQYSYQHTAQKPRADVVAEAYQALGVNASDSDAVIKKAYRKLMSEHHPDKLIAQGLPEAAIKQATERSQLIQQAYETVKKHRESINR